MGKCGVIQHYLYHDSLTLIEDVNSTKLHTVTLIPVYFRALYNSDIFTFSTTTLTEFSFLF